MLEAELQTLCISPSDTIREAIACIDRGRQGIALVVDTNRHLLGTISDGDVRRAMLDSIDLEKPVSALLARKVYSQYPKPVFARMGAGREVLIALMRQYVLRQIPILDDDGHVVDLVMLDDLVFTDEFPLQAVIMAGGQSTRLHPLARDLPKPMLPVGNRPLMELTISQMRQAGIRQVNLATHYKPETITDYFGDGDGFGVNINYLNEEQPMGTAGVLSLLEPSDEPVLVVNGDVLTHIDYRDMLDFHQQQEADMTVAVRQHEFQIPYDLVEMDGGLIHRISEKPVIQRFINVGIYLLNPDVLDYIPSDHPYDMTNLINQLVAEGLRVTNFPIHEYWLDIQEYNDYQQALMDVGTGIFEDLGVMQFEPGTPAPPGVIPLCVPEIRGNEWVYIKECLDTNWVSSVGPFVTSFEEMLADYIGTKHGVATNTGTAALHIALLVAGVKPDDEVLVSALTFIAPANAIRYVGAWPVFVDAEPNYWQMDTQRVVDFLENDCQWRGDALYNKCTGRRVKAIIPVHVLGHPCDMDPILEAAHQYQLTVIEDASESLGAQYRGRMVGSLGDIACFSFNGNKIITTGGGGMIVTNNATWARKAKYLTTQAKDDPLEYIHNQIGYNYRLTNLQAAMGCAQMEQLESFLDAKRRISAAYASAFENVAGIHPMLQASWAKSIFWMYTMTVDDAVYGMDSRALLHKMAECNIQSRPLWHPIYSLPPFQNCQSNKIEVSDRLYQQALSLPSSVSLTETLQAQVIEAIVGNFGKENE